MSKKKHDGPHFVMVTELVLDAPAWRAMSHGARSLYIALKRRYWPNRKNNGHIYLPQRPAAKELGSSPNQITRWFCELQYYGFIVMMSPGCLGVDGKGRAPRWRLTEVAYMRGTSSKGTEDMPTMDFLKWNGVWFSKHQAGGDRPKPKTESRPRFRGHTVTENGDTHVTENGDTQGNKRYGKRGQVNGPSVTENGSISINHVGGREGSGLGEESSDAEEGQRCLESGRHPTRARSSSATSAMSSSALTARTSPGLSERTRRHGTGSTGTSAMKAGNGAAVGPEPSATQPAAVATSLADDSSPRPALAMPPARTNGNGELTAKKPWSTPTVEEVPWDTAPVELRMLALGLPDAGVPPQGVAMPEAPSAPPAMTYQEQIEAIMKRSREQVEAIMKQPMLPGDRKRALQAVHNQEAVAKNNAQMRAGLH